MVGLFQNSGCSRFQAVGDCVFSVVQTKRLLSYQNFKPLHYDHEIFNIFGLINSTVNLEIDGQESAHRLTQCCTKIYSVRQVLSIIVNRPTSYQIAVRGRYQQHNKALKLIFINVSLLRLFPFKVFRMINFEQKLDNLPVLTTID